jgi:hypothetical protein
MGVRAAQIGISRSQPKIAGKRRQASNFETSDYCFAHIIAELSVG